MRNIDFKKLFILMICLVLLFIPTYIAIGSYYSNRHQTDVGDVTTLTISDPDGRKTVVTSQNDQNGLIELFKDINSSGSSVSSLSDTASTKGFMLATFETGDSELSYKYYFSTNSSDCYFIDPDGNIYRIAQAQAKAFLGTTLSVYLYDTAAPPILRAGETVINPETLDWHYLIAGGTYQQYPYTKTGNEDLFFDVGSDFNFSFDIAPADSNLKVYDGEVILYDGSHNNISQSSLPVKLTSNLTFVLEATWQQTEECEFYGSATYTFNADVSAPPIFKLGEEEIQHGDAVVLSGVNVTDLSALQVSFEPAMPNGFIPTFFSDGDYVHAILPFSYDIPNGTYNITVKYGITEQTLSLKVGEAKYDFTNNNDRDYTASKTLIETNFSQEDIAEYEKIYKEICATSESKFYITGKFINYETKGVLTSNGSRISLGFARNVILTNDPAKRTYIHPGVDFEVSGGVDVPAMGNGRVIYSGSCDILGKFVVIDHGYGLKSWYAHLSETIVTKDKLVMTGETIGKTGSSGFTIENRLHVCFTVDEIAVAPFSLWSEGLIFPEFKFES